MMPSALWQIGAVHLHDAYCKGSTTPTEVLESCLQRMHHLEPQIGAMTQIFQDQARLNAKQATERYQQGLPLSPLDGVPFTVKDNIFVRGTLSTWGTPALQHHTAQDTELAIQRLLDAGAVLVGKTNLCEFTLEGYTSNPVYGTTANPWDTALTPGGSSGGAVASVAAGYAAFAIGTDAGGSTRRPASHCGLVGLKLGLDTVLRDHGFPAYMYDFDVLGIMARDAQDTAIVLEVITGPTQRVNALNDKPILYVPQLKPFPLDPLITQACQQQVKALSEMGYAITESDLPLDLRFTTDRWHLMAERVLSDLFDQYPSWEQQASRNFVEMAQRGRQHSARLRTDLLHDIRQLRVEADGLFKDYSVVITPATAALPWPKASAFPNSINDTAVGPRGHAIFSSWVNAAGLPAIAIPAVQHLSPMPCGIQCVGPLHSEGALIHLAQKLLHHTHHQIRFPMEEEAHSISYYPPE